MQKLQNVIFQQNTDMIRFGQYYCGAEMHHIDVEELTMGDIEWIDIRCLFQKLSNVNKGRFISFLRSMQGNEDNLSLLPCEEQTDDQNTA